jgi:hypothetical protein
VSEVLGYGRVSGDLGRALTQGLGGAAHSRPYERYRESSDRAVRRWIVSERKSQGLVFCGDQEKARKAPGINKQATPRQSTTEICRLDRGADAAIDDILEWPE